MTLLTTPKKYNHSPSAIRDFLLCELRYAYYKLYVEWTDNEGTLRGKQVHDTLEWLGSRGFIEENLDLAIASHANSAPAYEHCPLDEDKLRVWIMNAWPAVVNLTPVKNEFWVRHQFASCKRPLVGRVDSLSGTDPEGIEGQCLVDYKSTQNMAKKPTPYEIKRSIQGLSYAICTGIPKVSFIYFSEFHEAEPVTHTYTDGELEYGRRYIEHICQTIEHRWEHGGWRQAQPGGLCSARWCENWNNCYGDS
jgi:hypothetical protein